MHGQVDHLQKEAEEVIRMSQYLAVLGSKVGGFGIEWKYCDTIIRWIHCASTSFAYIYICIYSIA